MTEKGKELIAANEEAKVGEIEETEEPLQIVLFQVSECYVYLIPPRKTAGSYRADEWNVNKWVWEGILKVISKGEECIIRLEDKNTGELYARAFLRNGEPHPVESVIDSSRYFVLRIEENIELMQMVAVGMLSLALDSEKEQRLMISKQPCMTI
ncbi:hypothetical protein V6N11_015494 [Hibiscus sabdariffa]|uniref:NECAP PHear domain-containing protein n=1 Tax=Hibiscus sabdariffa TaxID=183260 RepID=A0ABR2TSS5_9ROSI